MTPGRVEHLVVEVEIFLACLAVRLEGVAGLRADGLARVDALAERPDGRLARADASRRVRPSSTTFFSTNARRDAMSDSQECVHRSWR